MQAHETTCKLMDLHAFWTILEHAGTQNSLNPIISAHYGPNPNISMPNFLNLSKLTRLLSVLSVLRPLGGASQQSQTCYLSVLIHSGSSQILPFTNQIKLQ